jgi:murein DD-endopeptidase MepM/ murein hydrolase activator NlpD
VNAFNFDFDLQQEVAPGDRFEVAFEQTVNAAGESLGAPQLLFASLMTAAKSRSLYRYKSAEREVGWYDGNGASTVRSFMRTPVDGARITSRFGPRFHPVLRYTRLHGGTDFGAPVGTPIYAAADGVITSASPSACAGNMVIMKHDNGWVTRYFHLSRYADGLVAGKRVTQGVTIGQVGNTGTCTTGPHLHYEVHIDGQKVDPLSIKTEAGRKGLEGAERAAFLQQRDLVDVARAKHAE